MQLLVLRHAPARQTLAAHDEYRLSTRLKSRSRSRQERLRCKQPSTRPLRPDTVYFAREQIVFRPALRLTSFAQDRQESGTAICACKGIVLFAR